MTPFGIAPIPPLLPIENQTSKGERRRGFLEPTDSKVQGVVKGVVQGTAQAPMRDGGESAGRIQGGMLPSTPRISPWFSFPFPFPPLPRRASGGKKRRRVAQGGVKVPIGIRKGEYPEEIGPWLNGLIALMQFLLYVPGFSDLFYFAPKQFDPFQDFIDQYRLDQSVGEELSSAEIFPLFHSLAQHLPSILSREAEKICEYSFLKGLIEAFFSAGPALPKVNILPFQWERHLIWDGGEGLLPFLEGKCRPPEPNEWLLALKKGGGGARRQVAVRGNSLYYDLHAWIERRGEGRRVAWITYLKVGGIWYQCDEERVRPVSPLALEIPLAQSTLLYYKKVFPK